MTDTDFTQEQLDNLVNDCQMSLASDALNMVAVEEMTNELADEILHRHTLIATKINNSGRLAQINYLQANKMI